jgi:hypothetical protein
LLLLLTVSPACSDDDDTAPAADAGVTAGNSAGGTSAAGRSGAGNGGTGGSKTATGPAQLGAACVKDGDCTGGNLCDQEIPQVISVPGAPNGGKIDQSLFPGGSCTPLKLGTYNPGTTCDPTEPRGAQGCGEDGVCTVENTPTSSADGSTPQVACRKTCEPSAEKSGCDREGYTCDFVNRYCLEGCRDDAECRILTRDTDNNGQADTLAYDESSTATCNKTTARCEHPAGGKKSSDACASDAECAEDGVCIVDGSQLAGQRFPGGTCTRRGCEFEGLECDSGTVCQALRPWLGASATEALCFEQCTVGAESADLRSGAKGHGEGCRDGYRCHYNGGKGAESGVCVGGVYNDIKNNNVGSLCKVNSDCYSPYGLGYCLIYGITNTLQSPGICTLFDCAAPGLPKDLCGAGNECVSTGDGDETMCAHDCKAASDCPADYACTDDDRDATTPKTCFPLCLSKDDCRSNEQCKPINTTSMAGTCQLQ